SLQKRAENLSKAAGRISTAGHRSALIPYVARALVDSQNPKTSLTQMQKAVAEPLVKLKLRDRFLERYRALPPSLASALGLEAFTQADNKEVDAWLVNTLVQGANGLEKSGRIKGSVQLDG